MNKTNDIDNNIADKIFTVYKNLNHRDSFIIFGGILFLIFLFSNYKLVGVIAVLGIFYFLLYVRDRNPEYINNLLTDKEKIYAKYAENLSSQFNKYKDIQEFLYKHNEVYAKHNSAYKTLISQLIAFFKKYELCMDGDINIFLYLNDLDRLKTSILNTISQYYLVSLNKHVSNSHSPYKMIAEIECMLTTYINNVEKIADHIHQQKGFDIHYKVKFSKIKEKNYYE